MAIHYGNPTLTVDIRIHLAAAIGQANANFNEILSFGSEVVGQNFQQP